MSFRTVTALTYHVVIGMFLSACRAEVEWLTPPPLNLGNDKCINRKCITPSLLQVGGWRVRQHFGESSGIHHTSDGDGVGHLNTSQVVQFEPSKWNSDESIKRSHNCYEYALNDIDNVAVQNCHDKLASSSLLKVGDEHSKHKKGLSTACRQWFHIPGYDYHQTRLHAPVQYNRSTVTCENLLERVALDGQGVLLWAGPDRRPTTEYPTGTSWKHEEQCPEGAYMASLVIKPGRRFHFYRRDHECTKPENKGRWCWSHKPGILDATNLDASGKEMPDLHLANRSYGPRSYSDVCGFFCVPSNLVAQTKSDFYRGGSNTPWAPVL